MPIQQVQLGKKKEILLLGLPLLCNKLAPNNYFNFVPNFAGRELKEGPSG